MLVFWILLVWFVASYFLNENQRKINEQRQREMDAQDARCDYRRPYGHTQRANPISRDSAH